MSRKTRSKVLVSNWWRSTGRPRKRRDSMYAVPEIEQQPRGRHAAMKLQANHMSGDSVRSREKETNASTQTPLWIHSLPCKPTNVVYWRCVNARQGGGRLRTFFRASLVSFPDFSKYRRAIRISLAARDLRPCDDSTFHCLAKRHTQIRPGE